MTVLRVVVIGGDAVGMTAASHIKRRLRDAVDVTVIQEQQWTSYSACGIPYWIAGEVNGPTRLVARSPERHRENGIDVRIGTRATAVDVDRQTVQARVLQTGEKLTFPYDHLVLGTGAKPVFPHVPGLHLPGVLKVHTLDDGLAATAALARKPRCAVVLGAGFLGLEVAEAAITRGMDTIVLEMAAEPMQTLDLDMGARLRLAMIDRGAKLQVNEPVEALIAGPDGRVAAVRSEQGEYPAEIVFMGLGLSPRSDLAVAAGLPVGEAGGILTDSRQRVLGQENIWAGGDCTEVHDRVSGRRCYMPQGTHANKHGRVIGLNISGQEATFPGIVGTAVVRFQDVEVARVGLLESEGPALGLDLACATIDAKTRAGYFPGATPITVKMIGDRATGRLLGCQIIGGPGSGKRIDIAATAIWNRMAVADVIDMDLAYSPPLSPPWDPVQTAARRLAAIL